MRVLQCLLLAGAPDADAAFARLFPTEAGAAVVAFEDGETVNYDADRWEGGRGERLRFLAAVATHDAVASEAAVLFVALDAARGTAIVPEASLSLLWSGASPLVRSGSTSHWRGKFGAAYRLSIV